MINFEQALQQRNLDNDTLVEDPSRLRWKDTLWHRVVHYRENKQLDKQISQEVHQFFQERYHFEDATTFERVWDELASRVWNPSQPLTAGAVRALERSFQNCLYMGQGIEGPPIDETSPSAPVRHFVRALLHGDRFTAEIMQDAGFDAIFVRHDPVLMGYFREALQDELLHLAAHPPESESQALIWKAFVGNLIALFPFCYPEEGTHFSIPRLENGQCIVDDYQVEVIPMHFPGLTSPMNALGMTPVKSSNAPDLLVFMGTTFPAGSGFAATILSDFTPGHSVGQLIYRRNKEKIDKWLEGKTGVTAVGLSLGGALVFHALRHHPDNFAHAETFSPPGLYERNWRKKISPDCKVNIYTQKGDIVTQLGHFPKGDNVSLYSIYPHHEGVREVPWDSHIRVFFGLKKLTVIKTDIDRENNKFGRGLLTRLHQFVAPFFVFLPFTIGVLIHKGIQKVRKFAAKLFTNSHS